MVRLLAAGVIVPAGVETVAGCVAASAGLGLGGGVLVVDALEAGGFGTGVVTGGFGLGVGVTTDAVVTAAGGVEVPAEAGAEVVEPTAGVPAAAATPGPDAATTATPVASAVR
jgi:hypothetical protein